MTSRGQSAGKVSVVFADHGLQAVDVSAAHKLAHMRTWQRFGRSAGAEARPQPVSGKNFAAIGQFRQLQVLRQRAVEVPNQADSGEEWQLERSAKRNLVFAIETIRSSKLERVVVVGCEVDEV